MNEVKSVMSAYITMRKEEALKKAKTDEDIATVESKFRFDNWINSAANRASQIQIATHIAKFTHPDSRAASLLSVGNVNAKGYVGTHSLVDVEADATGNAGALDVYGLLSQRVNDQALWELAMVDDQDFIDAVGIEATNLFKRVIKKSSDIDSYQKQIYWCSDEGDVLLSPLTSSSFSHSLYRRINEDRFSEKSKQSWAARRAGKDGDPLTIYSNLGMLKIGGSKPQIVSALNSKRGGKQYMLSCVPPINLKQYDVPLGTSCFKHFEQNNQAVIYTLKWYLIAQQGKSMNYEQRNKRDEMALNLIRSFVSYAKELRQKANWLNDSKLNENEKRFVQTGQYTDEIANDFSKQINRWIGSPRRRATADDLSHWMRLFKQEVR